MMNNYSQTYAAEQRSCYYIEVNRRAGFRYFGPPTDPVVLIYRLHEEIYISSEP